MEFGNRHDTTDTMDFCPRQLVIYIADLLRGSRQLVADLLRGNWCNGFWPWMHQLWCKLCLWVKLQWVAVVEETATAAIKTCQNEISGIVYETISWDTTKFMYNIYYLHQYKVWQKLSTKVVRHFLCKHPDFNTT